MKVDSTILTPVQKALKTARWARIMTKWLITHSSKDGVKWQFVEFNGKKGQESTGIVDMIAIRKNHNEPEIRVRRGDRFEIVLIQVKGGGASSPSTDDIRRMMEVKKHHRADRVVLAEWELSKKLRLFEYQTGGRKQVEAAAIFGKLSKSTKSELSAKVLAGIPATALLTPGQKAAATKRANAKAAKLEIRKAG